MFISIDRPTVELTPEDVWPCDECEGEGDPRCCDCRGHGLLHGFDDNGAGLPAAHLVGLVSND